MKLSIEQDAPLIEREDVQLIRHAIIMLQHGLPIGDAHIAAIARMFDAHPAQLPASSWRAANYNARMIATSRRPPTAQ